MPNNLSTTPAIASATAPESVADTNIATSDPVITATAPALGTTITAVTAGDAATDATPQNPQQNTNSPAPKNTKPILAPLTKKAPSKAAHTLAHAIAHLFSAPQNKILSIAAELKAFNNAELKITQDLLAHLGQEKFRFDNLLQETGLPLEQISNVVHALKSFEIINARQSVLRFVKQADPQLSLNDQLDALGYHRSMRLGFAEQGVVGEALCMTESQVFFLLKQRKVIQPTDLSYFVNNAVERKAVFRLLVWSRLFNKVFMDENQLLHFVPKYKAPKAAPNPSHTNTPVASDPSSSSSSNNNTGDSSSVAGSVEANSYTAAETATDSTTTTDSVATNNSALAPTKLPSQADIKSESTEADRTKATATTTAIATTTTKSTVINPQANINNTAAIPLAVFATAPVIKTTPSWHQDPIIEAWLDSHPKMNTTSTDSLHRVDNANSTPATTPILKFTPLYTALKQSWGLQPNNLSLRYYHSLEQVNELPSYQELILTSLARKHHATNLLSCLSRRT